MADHYPTIRCAHMHPGPTTYLFPHYPFYQIMIDYNGDVLLCPHDWAKKKILGNINESSIFDLWINEKSQSAKQNLTKKNRLFPPCKTCNVRGDVVGKEMFDNWQEN